MYADFRIDTIESTKQYKGYPAVFPINATAGQHITATESIIEIRYFDWYLEWNIHTKKKTGEKGTDKTENFSGKWR